MRACVGHFTFSLFLCQFGQHSVLQSCQSAWKGRSSGGQGFCDTWSIATSEQLQRAAWSWVWAWIIFWLTRYFQSITLNSVCSYYSRLKSGTFLDWFSDFSCFLVCRNTHSTTWCFQLLAISESFCEFVCLALTDWHLSIFDSLPSSLCHPQLTDKAALLFRQYVKDSLYDRISTRPFLNLVEKRWLTFQLLCALNQCHRLNVSYPLHTNTVSPLELLFYLPHLCLGVPRWYQIRECDGDQLELVTTDWFCQLQAHLFAWG